MDSGTFQLLRQIIAIDFSRTVGEMQRNFVVEQRGEGVACIWQFRDVISVWLPGSDMGTT